MCSCQVCVIVLLISQCLLPLSSTSYFRDLCLFFFFSEFHDTSSESNLVRDDDSDLGYGEGGKGERGDGGLRRISWRRPYLVGKMASCKRI